MQPQEFSELVDNIEAALVRFESTSNHAVLRVYMRNDMQNQAIGVVFGSTIRRFLRGERQ
jgi:hypothetical protein